MINKDYLMGYGAGKNLGGGGSEPTGTVDIATNGTHNVKNYASANVNVPNSYAQSDEGKVVSDGALVSQTSDTVTENDTYDTTLIDSLTVNVSGGESTPTLYQNGDGNTATLYAENTVIDSGALYALIKNLKGAANLKTVKLLKTTAYGGSNYQLNTAFQGCSLLESVQLLNGISSSGYCEDIIKDCPRIKEFITGDIGYPNDTGMGSTNSSYLTFRNISVAFDIIIYTTATTLATVPSYLKTGSPWGATNATVIYKNSVTGEVLT